MQAGTSLSPGGSDPVVPGVVDRPLLSQAPAERVAPSPARPDGAERSERYYVGRRQRRTEVFVVTANEVDRLPHHRYRSAAAFDWGDRTAGALELAFALLTLATDSRPPDQVCRAFSDQVVARLDRAGFVLGDGDIALWLLTALHGSDPAGGAGPDRSRSGLRGAVARLRTWLRSH